MFKKDRRLENQKAMIKNRDVLIGDLERKNEELTKENLAVYEENKDLRFENDEQSDLIKRIERLVNSNKYNNEKAVLNKLKELVNDYQSQN